MQFRKCASDSVLSQAGFRKDRHHALQYPRSGIPERCLQTHRVTVNTRDRQQGLLGPLAATCSNGSFGGPRREGRPAGQGRPRRSSCPAAPKSGDCFLRVASLPMGPATGGYGRPCLPRAGAAWGPHRARSRRSHERPVNEDGKREALGAATGPAERGVKLVVADFHNGLRAAVRRVFNSMHQRFCVHWIRNAPTQAPIGRAWPRC